MPVGLNLLDEHARFAALTVLSRFRTDFHSCLTARADALFELPDALFCTDGPGKRWWTWRWLLSIGVVTVHCMTA
jgi:hypothetical protein